MIFFLPAYSQSHAQSKNLIIKSYPFYFVTTRGDFPKGGNDDFEMVQPDSANAHNNTGQRSLQQKDTSVIVYVETSTRNIIWDSALMDNRLFHLIALPQQEPSLIAGFLKSGKQVNIPRSKRNYIFLLQLSGSKNNSLQQKLNIFHTILLKAKYKGKPFIYKTGLPKEIIPLPAS